MKLFSAPPGSLFSNKKEGFSLSIGIEKEAKKDRSNSHFKEWNSPDGKKQVLIRMIGGRKYGGAWIKDIYLIDKNFVGGGEIMRVQEIIGPDGNVEHNVYLDVMIDREENTWPTMASASYSSRNSGELHSFYSWFAPVKPSEYEEMSDEEFEALYRTEMATNGIRHERELPKYIDIDATITSFVDQINRKDFVKPALIAKEMSPEEIMQIEENKRLRQEKEEASEQAKRAEEEARNNRAVVVMFNVIKEKIESVLPSGRERKRGSDFADRFVSIKPQLMEMQCELSHSGHRFGKTYRRTVTLSVDNSQESSIKKLFEKAGISIQKYTPEQSASRWMALKMIADMGHFTAEDFYKEIRTEMYVIYESTNFASEDADRVNLHPETNEVLQNIG